MSRCVRSILTSLALLAALGVVLGIGLAVVYADHIYSPYEGLTQLQVIDPAHDAPGGFDARFDEPVDPDAAPGLLREAVLWTKTSHATLLRQNALGYNVCAASDLLEGVVGADDLGPDASPGAYVRDDPAFLDPYVSHGLLFPSRANLPVLGTFDPAMVPALLAEADALLSFAALTSADANMDAVEGVYYTDAADAEGLAALFEGAGYRVYVMSRPLSAALAELPANLLSEDPLARVTLFSLVALLFCLGYVALWLFRSGLGQARVRHLFGLSRRRIAGSVAVSCALVLAAQTSCLALMLPASFSYLGEKDLARLLVGTTLVSAAVLFATGVVGWLWFYRRLGVRGGRP